MPGQVVFVHATDATLTQLARMKAEGTTILVTPIDLDSMPLPPKPIFGIPVALGLDSSAALLCAKEYLLSRNGEFGDQALWEWPQPTQQEPLGWMRCLDH